MTVLFLCVLGGCSGTTGQMYRAVDFDPMAQDGARYAIGGFVLGAHAELDHQAAIGTAQQNADPAYQTDTWAPLLYGFMLTGREQLEVWSWGALRDNIPVDTITNLQASHARGGNLPVAMLKAVAVDMPEITYLVLARIDANETDIGGAGVVSATNNAAEASRQVYENGDPLSRTVKTRRTVELTLDVYDLRSGLSVWRSSVRKNKTELFSRNADDSKDLVVKPATDDGALPEIQVKGASLDMPLLDDVLADACATLVKKLFVAKVPDEQDFAR